LDVINGTPEVGGLGIFIPYSYNVQGLIILFRKYVEPGLLKFRAARAFLVEGQDARRLVVEEAGLGRPTVGKGVQLLQKSCQITQDRRQLRRAFLVVALLGALELWRDLHPPHGHRRGGQADEDDRIAASWRIIVMFG
jgi:hypothetical protein